MAGGVNRANTEEDVIFLTSSVTVVAAPTLRECVQDGSVVSRQTTS